MKDIAIAIEQWISIDTLVGLTALSILGFVGSLIAIPWILIRLPSDYFDTRVERHWMRDHHPILRIICLIMKNIIGAVFVLVGFLMLFMPGQGLLTMLIGISFMDFPNKRALEAKIIGQRTVLNVVNKMRFKFNKQPFTINI